MHLASNESHRGRDCSLNRQPSTAMSCSDLHSFSFLTWPGVCCIMQLCERSRLRFQPRPSQRGSFCCGGIGHCAAPQPVCHCNGTTVSSERSRCPPCQPAMSPCHVTLPCHPCHARHMMLPFEGTCFRSIQQLPPWLLSYTIYVQLVLHLRLTTATSWSVQCREVRGTVCITCLNVLFLTFCFSSELSGGILMFPEGTSAWGPTSFE